MRGKRYEYGPLTGVDHDVPPPENSAFTIENYTVDQSTQGWDNRVGWEKYFVGKTNLYAPFGQVPRVDSLYIWPKHAGSLEYIVFEAGGALYFVQDWTSPVAIRTLATSQNIPTSAEVPRTYTPFGKWLCMLNGHNAPIRYSGWDHESVQASYPVYPLGWSGIPAPPTPWDVDVDPSTHTADVGKILGIWAEGSGEYGLGSTSSSERNGYRWKISCISNAGGESPLSGPSQTVEWSTPSAGDWANKRFVVGMDIPIGQAGTIARMIYRTKNLGDGDLATSETQIYYFVGVLRNNTDTFYYDHWSDNQLGAEAPGAADSVIFPASSARYSAVFKGCFFIDGGTSAGTRLYWSLPGKPDQYTALDYADVGTRTGGEITGFYSHQNYLLIFREQAVDILYGSYPNFEVRPLMQGVGTRASQTARTIPDLNGVIFLASDGIYIVSGSVDGGGTIQAKKVSVPIQHYLERINLDVSARAVAEYSSKWREYHIYMAADGTDRPSIGLVFHIDKLAWSTRVGFPVGAIAVNGNGDFIFGHHTGYTGVANDPAGLFVITRRHTNGMTLIPAAGQVEAMTVYNTAPTTVYRSAWHSFGDPAEKMQVLYLYLYALTVGDDPITVTVLKDYSTTGVNVPAIRLQRADWPDQNVHGLGKVGTAVWEESLTSCYRISVSNAFPKTAPGTGLGGNSSSWWAFEISTTADFILHGYATEVQDGGTGIIAAKGVL